MPADWSPQKRLGADQMVLRPGTAKARPGSPPGRALRNEVAYRFPFGSGSSFTETSEHIPLAVARTQWWPVSGTPQYLTVATVQR